MAAMQEIYTISEGPSREEFFDSLRLGTKLQITVLVTRGGKTTRTRAEVVVDGARAEDGSRQSWQAWLFDAKASFGQERLEVYYSTKNRKGAFSVQ